MHSPPCAGGPTLEAPMDDRRSGTDRRRILIVDDDDGIRMLMKAIFARLDIETEFARDGRVAQVLLRQNHYDAVVLDLFVPSVSGFELIREIKAARPALLPRTLILTAAAETILRDFDDGKLVSRVMRKPFDLNGLVEAVLACCGASNEAAVNRNHAAAAEREYGGDPPGNHPRPSDL